MEITVNYEHREEDMRALLDVEALAAHVIRAEMKPDSTEVSVSFVTDAAIHELNRTWRDVDRPTDVLSFECDGYDDDFDEGMDIEGLPVAGEGGFEVSFELGDVVIAPDVAERQAIDYGLSFADEVSLLLVHGLLHLCGYDHMEQAEAEEMEARERELLSSFYNRPFLRSAADAPASCASGKSEA